MKCQRCGQEADEFYDHLGQKLCEDCYMDALSPAKGCDPWAVHSAKGLETADQDLTPSQQRILERLAQGPVEPQKLAAELGLKPSDLQREVATLRHMEKVRGFPHQGRSFLILFDQANPDWAQG